jgi:hypothetical protein
VRPTPPSTAPTQLDTVRARARGARLPVPCRGQPVSDVVVLAQPPLGNRILGRFRWAQRRATALHATTRDPIIRRFLLLGPGDACDELRRSESERILRAQPYLVDARVLAYDDGAGGVRLEVETRDEFSVILGLSALAGGGAPPVSALRLGEANLMGRGVYTMAQWRDGGRGYRDSFVARMVHYQLFGRPYQLAVLGERRDVGGQWGVDLSHPFYTDLQRIAWRAAGGGADDYLELLRPGAQQNALAYRRRHLNAGGLLRVGTPGRLSLFGASLSYERSETADLVRVFGPDGFEPDSGPPLGFVPGARYPGQNATRVNALWGVGRSTSCACAASSRSPACRTCGAGSRRARWSAAAWRCSARATTTTSPRPTCTPGSAAGARSSRASCAARRATTTAATTGAAWSPAGARRGTSSRDHWRFVTSAEFSGVWRPRIPVQVQLGRRDGGVRGYNGAVESGTARAVVRVESRRVLGAVGNVGDLGLAAFADAGKLWAGGAPYGVDSPVRAALGVGALGAFPRGSRKLWRVDVARPLSQVPGAPKVQFILENRDLTRFFWREPRDVELGRERASPVSVFNWP